MKNNEYEVLNEYNQISKSRSLLSLDTYSGYGLAQYLLLDMYLAQINPMDSNNKIIKFPKDDYEKFKEIERIKPTNLRNDLLKLMSSPVEIQDPFDPNAYRIKPLFRECKVEKEEDGRYWITMECDQDMQDLFFSPNKIGYIKYRLGMVKYLDLPSRKLYDHLRQIKTTKKNYIELHQIRSIMGLTAITYEDTSEITRKIKKSVVLINQYTNIDVSYTKRNNPHHKIIGLDFVVSQKENIIDEELTLLIAELLETSFDSAKPIALEAQKNRNLSNDDLIKRISFVKTKSNVKDITSYAIALIKNDQLWKKIQDSSPKNTQKNSVTQQDDPFLKIIESNALKGSDDQ